ncbi:GNAT family N-acetyltransferase [Microlunatus parietis]|uniref:GNAT superfamily N-acetyltransferase n=1 Tax=Microlunatus parietis TaxID=682979 RepID=A0A7Y9LCS5_9ACTN|nr:GNAT family N-acetyltransferase [Microlunatus parietis]NYE71221.1 GNAT superfamily N-acetyltransferase [Microlunatus parietis]
MPAPLTVRRATDADRDPVINAFGRCTDEEVTSWVMAGESDASFRDSQVPLIIDSALKQDEVWIAGAGPDIWAVAIWQRVDSLDRFRADADQARELHRQNPDFAPFRRLAAVTAYLAEAHPQHFPHLYLQVMVTVPERRGHGAGGALLDTRLALLEAEGSPAFLEASTERSARLYSRHGFRRDSRPHTLPEGGPTLIPMWFRLP